MNNIYKIVLLILFLQLTACADLSYYLQSVKGQLSIMQKSQDIDDVLADQTIDPILRQQLELIENIRHFAFDELKLPESGSYTQYADLDRRYVLKNLFASDEFSISLLRWCYPIVGCTGYRGYFDEKMLAEFRATLELQGKDIYIANVPAYSTLGWFDDPVLNTFIYWPELRIAGLIFHELAHQRLYIDDDTQFNESFAVAVQQAGVEKWLFQNEQFEKLKRYKQHLANRQLIVNLIDQTRSELKQLYQMDLSDTDKRLVKKQLLARLKQKYRQLSSRFEVADGFKFWFKGEINNAKLASISTYHKKVKAFRNLLENRQGDYVQFFKQVKIIASLSKPERYQCLSKWEDNTGEPLVCE